MVAELLGAIRDKSARKGKRRIGQPRERELGHREVAQRKGQRVPSSFMAKSRYADKAVELLEVDPDLAGRCLHLRRGHFRGGWLRVAS